MVDIVNLFFHRQWFFVVVVIILVVIKFFHTLTRRATVCRVLKELLQS